MATIDDLEIGSVITFRSKAVNDNNFYHGKVLGKVTADIALTYGDIYTYNSSVQSADNTVPSVDLQEFLIIKLLEKVDDSTRYIIPFSTDWINESTLTIITTDRIALIKVFDVDSTNIQDVLNLLISAGFKARTESLN